MEAKLSELQEIIEKLSERLPIVGRENVVLSPLHDVLQILSSCQEKVNCEACRIGAYNKRIRVAEASETISPVEVLQLIILTFNIVNK